MTIPAKYRKAVYIVAGLVAVLAVAGVVAIYTGVLDAARLNESIAAVFGIIAGIITGGASLLALLNLTPDPPA
jgi:hypothetical protein